MATTMRWLLTALLFFSSASAARETLCASTRQRLGAKQGSWVETEYPAAYSVTLAQLLPLLSEIDGIRDLSPSSFTGNPLEPTNLTYEVGVACFEHYLFLSKGSDYLVTIDLKAKKKLSGVKVVGLPTRIWHVKNSVYAMNLATGVDPQSTILDVRAGTVYFNPGPSKFGGETVALVVPQRGVLIQSYSWGAPSVQGFISLFLFSLQGRMKQRTLQTMPACTVKAPKNSYGLRYTLVETGIVMHETTAEGDVVSKHLTSCANLAALLKA